MTGSTHLQALSIFLLLLVYDAEAEVDLVCLFKIGLHRHDLGKGLFGMVQRAIAVVQYTDSVPKLRLLCVEDTG